MISVSSQPEAERGKLKNQLHGDTSACLILWQKVLLLGLAQPPKAGLFELNPAI